MQAAVRNPSPGVFQIFVQGGEPGYNPAGISPAIGEPSPRARWAWGFAILSYVQDYHNRF